MSLDLKNPGLKYSNWNIAPNTARDPAVSTFTEGTPSKMPFSHMLEKVPKALEIQTNASPAKIDCIYLFIYFF